MLQIAWHCQAVIGAPSPHARSGLSLSPRRLKWFILKSSGFRPRPILLDFLLDISGAGSRIQLVQLNTKRNRGYGDDHYAGNV